MRTIDLTLSTTILLQLFESTTNSIPISSSIRASIDQPLPIYLTISTSSTTIAQPTSTIQDLQIQTLTRGTLALIRTNLTLPTITIAGRDTSRGSIIVPRRMGRGLRQVKKSLLSSEVLRQSRYQYITPMTSITLRILSTISPSTLGRTQIEIYIRTRSNRYIIV